jgi:NADH-quinone oxidoreductase subunit L
MTVPLMALAVGAIVAGFVGIPAALGGGNAIEHFLHPSFSASSGAHGDSHGASAGDHQTGAAAGQGAAAHAAEDDHGGGLSHTTIERLLMVFSVLIAAIGIALAWKFYVWSPEISERLANQFAGAHRTLSNKYYVDELYNGTVISGTMASGRGLWTFDRTVVDGAVNGSSWMTLFGSWMSGLTDRTIVDGMVNFVGRFIQESSYWFRRLQTGLVQNYALLMLFGVFAFVSIYLIVR